MTAERLFGLVTTAVIVAAIVAGLLLIESPTTARMARFDSARLSELSRIAQEINQYIIENEQAPETLTFLGGEYNYADLISDPRSGEPYLYEPLEGDSYRLCAEFETDGPHDFFGVPRSIGFPALYNVNITPSVAEGAGQHCFVITVTRS